MSDSSCVIALIIPERGLNLPNSAAYHSYNSRAGHFFRVWNDWVRSQSTILEWATKPTQSYCSKFCHKCFSRRHQVSAVSHFPLFAQQTEKAFYIPFFSSKFTLYGIYDNTHTHSLSTSKQLHCSFFFFGLTCGIWKFLGQRLNLSHICGLCHSCGNARALTCFTGWDQTSNATETSQIIKPLLHSGNSSVFVFGGKNTQEWNS